MSFEDKTKSHNKLYCSTKCKTKSYRIRNWDRIRKIERRYAISVKGRKRAKEFTKTEKIKSIRRKYYHSEKGKAFIKRFQSSEKWKSYIKKYNTSEKAKLQKKKYQQSEKGKEIARKNAALYAKRYPHRIKGYQEKYRKTTKYQEKEHKFRHSEKGRALSRKKCRARRGRKLEVKERFTPLMEKAVSEAFENKCFITGITNEEHIKRYKQRLNLDHIDPLYHKNALSFDNVCLISKPENTRKGTKRWDFYSEEQIKRIKNIQIKAKQLYEQKYNHLEK